MYGRLFENSSSGARALEAEHKFGANAAVGTSDETIWTAGSVFPWDSLSEAQALEIVSGELNDAAAGTGARTVQVDGLDGNYMLQSESVSLNGTTAVDLTKTWLRVFRMRVTSAGSQKGNEGAITLRLDGAGATVGQIVAGDGQTLMAVWTVPADYSQAWIRSFWGGVGKSDDATLRLFVHPFGEAWQLKETLPLYQGRQYMEFEDPLPVTPKSDIDLRAVSASASVRVDGGFHIYLARS